MLPLTRFRLGFICTFILFVIFASSSVHAGSTALSMIPFTAGGCGIGGGTTNFTVRIAFNSATDFDYVASVVSGPVGLGGTDSGTVPAGSSANTPISLTFNSVATPAPWSFVIQIDSFVAGSPQDRATATVSCPATIGPYAVTPISSIDISALTGLVGSLASNCINDSRLNGGVDVDCAAPVAVYSQDDGFSVYGINPSNSQGVLALLITSGDIDDVGVPDVNTLLAEGTISSTGQSIHIYRLTSGEYQLNTFYADGKPYIIAWDDAGNVRHIAN
jgi:hypothetical protein